jgi:hypothetical protein
MPLLREVDVLAEASLQHWLVHRKLIIPEALVILEASLVKFQSHCPHKNSEYHLPHHRGDGDRINYSRSRKGDRITCMHSPSNRIITCALAKE